MMKPKDPKEVPMDRLQSCKSQVRRQITADVCLKRRFNSLALMIEICTCRCTTMVCALPPWTRPFMSLPLLRLRRPRLSPFQQPTQLLGRHHRHHRPLHLPHRALQVLSRRRR